MRTEIDLDAASEAGIIGEDQAIKLRNFQAEQDGISNASSEKFRLFGGYADLVIGIGTAMILAAVFIFMVSLENQSKLFLTLIAMATPVGIWQLTKRINLRSSPATAFALTGGFAAFTLMAVLFPTHEIGIKWDRGDDWTFLVFVPPILLLWLFWRRFRFPPTLALAVGGYTLLLLGVSRNSAIGPLHGNDLAAVIALVSATGTMLAAIWWDLTDIRRETERSQVAFWLHCCAGVLMSRALFSLLTGIEITEDRFVLTGIALSDFPYVIAMITVAALISLLLDRRSLLVGCLVPTIGIFDSISNGPKALAAGLLLAGVALVFFSAAWVQLRTRLLAVLPPKLAAQLPRTSLLSEGQRPTRQHQPLWHLK
ncbi:MAG: hypothetical protein AAFQ27_09940 [Pseudomonadota bacterium]